MHIRTVNKENLKRRSWFHIKGADSGFRRDVICLIKTNHRQMTYLLLLNLVIRSFYMILIITILPKGNLSNNKTMTEIHLRIYIIFM